MRRALLSWFHILLVLTFGLSITDGKPLPLSSLAVFVETRIGAHFLAIEEANSKNAITNQR